MLKKSLFMFLTIISLFLFAACSDNKNEIDLEFEQNYFLLENFFYYQERLKSISEYRDMSIKNMYNSVKGYFKGSGFTSYFSPSEANYYANLLTGDENKPTVFLYYFDNLPVIIITGFKRVSNKEGGTYQEFKDILQEIKGAKIAVIDLRNNGGGDFEHCLKMSAELSPYNEEMFYTIDRYYGETIKTHYFPKDSLKENGVGTETKWIFMVNSGTASASEVFVSAVKYTRPDETIIVGETTYGKAIGQYYFYPTQAGGMAGITGMRIFAPDGTTYNETGIFPTIPANPDDDTEISQAVYDAAVALGHEFSFSRNSRQSQVFPSYNPSKRTDLGLYKIINISK